ncbi:hypothetical protein ACFPOA_00195 [Lysobacter niabensis]|uniref:hypothetical protein n=1 Tax=Agrilutibacter niabensis TaxID=380628 RepID=UPI00360FA3C1
MALTREQREKIKQLAIRHAMEGKSLLQKRPPSVAIEPPPRVDVAVLSLVPRTKVGGPEPTE